MAKSDIDLDLWRKLYELASRVHKLAPWTWMEEIDIFGIEIPESEDLIFVSVMGLIAEHFAVALYPSVEALTSLWELHHDRHAVPERVLEIPQVQLSFENREFLEPEDFRFIKQLDLKFRGKNAWPQFRSYRPGFAPWFIGKDEATMLAAALEQLLEMAPRIQADPLLLRPDNPHAYLVRTYPGTGGRWSEEFRNIPPADISIPRVLPGSDAVRQCHLLPKLENEIEVDFFMIRARIGDMKTRPHYPYCLLMVESDRGSVVGHEMLVAKKSMGEMLRSIPDILIDRFKQLGMRPSRLRVRPGRLADIIRPTCEVLGIELRLQKQLSQLDAARRGLMEFFARGN